VERVNVTNTIVERTVITNVYTNGATSVVYRNRGVPGAVTTVTRTRYVSPPRVNVRVPPTTVVTRQVVVRREPPAVSAHLARAVATLVEPRPVPGAVGHVRADRPTAVERPAQLPAPEVLSPRETHVPVQRRRDDRPPEAVDRMREAREQQQARDQQARAQPEQERQRERQEQAQQERQQQVQAEQARQRATFAEQQQRARDQQMQQQVRERFQRQQESERQAAEQRARNAEVRTRVEPPPTHVEPPHQDRPARPEPQKPAEVKTPAQRKWGEDPRNDKS
jgi:flagellar biosynthesis GTPase FlhF